MFRMGVDSPRYHNMLFICEDTYDYSNASSWMTLSNASGLVHIVGVIYSCDGVVTTVNDCSIVCGDVKSHRLLTMMGKDLSGIERNRVLDLNDDGERWEGDVLNSKPYGWGVLYDSENRKMYEGFRVGSVNVCYGIQ